MIEVNEQLAYIKHFLKKEKPSIADVVECYLTAADLYLQLEDADKVIECLTATEKPSYHLLCKQGKMSEVTKRALEQSLKNLLLKKPLTKITINDITEDCGINRMTFYYHFKDIYDLVEWSCLEDARKALEEKKTHDTWQEGFLNIFEAVLANKPFVMNVYRCVDREQVEKYLKPLTDGLIMGVIDEQSKGITVRDEDKEFIARIYSYVFIGIMLDWIKGDMKEDPRLIIDKLALLIKDSVSDALNRFKL